ncbi:uncharacterized protein [Apostichopus japonicus]|uniref:uncharacterized protein isoform X2 n=1 Tax=Stichopus japonicus TaxID=307972 RepID=UPI003AB30FFB
MELLSLLHVALLIMSSCPAVCCSHDTPLLISKNVPDACGTDGVCHCYNTEYDDFEVTCNGSIRYVPRNLPKNTSFLGLRNNYVETIEAGTFVGLRSLKALDLSNNKLKSLSPKLLEDLSSLRDFNVSYNELTYLPETLFKGLRKLETIDLDENKLQNLPANLFKNLSSVDDLSLEKNEITVLQKGGFAGLSSLSRLYLANNNICLMQEGSFQGLSQVGIMTLGFNKLQTLPTKSFVGLSSTLTLHLEGNEIRMLQEKTFEGLPQVDFLDLSSNSISTISSGFFNQSGNCNLMTLFLQRNNITTIQRDTFKGLEKLRLLCLYSNKIHFIEDNSFLLMDLRYVYLFQNDLTNITGNPFASDVMEQLHLYGNEIDYIEAQSLVGIPNDTVIYVSCEFLSSLPLNANHDNIKCVTSSSLPSMEQGNIITALALNTDGFSCDFSILADCECTPCGAGTYGDTVSGGCRSCPVGGFYQDEIAQTEPAHHSAIPCKICNTGTYAKNGRGTSAKDCEVCPEGTNQTIDAGFRACYCKENYARVNRYGPCYICLEEGLDCTQEFQTLQYGYMWNWDIPPANLTNYERFVYNVEMDNDSVSMNTYYKEEIPRIYKCPRLENCANDNGSITGNCAKGYTGWLCTNCEPGYYSVLTTCVPCPNVVILIVESGVFFLVCALFCFLLTWQHKRKADKELETRSVIDVMIARLKILLGFYQVVGEIFTSLHDINWKGPLVIMGKFISAFEINLLRLFVRPRCFDMKLDLNPKIQFIIAAISPVVIVLVPFLCYQAKKLYVYIKFSPVVRVSSQSYFENLKQRIVACVVVLWFIIYPPVCSVIFSLYPLSCKTFHLDKGNTYNITRLRSDFDVDCTGLKTYHIFAFVLTVTYVVTFPACLLYILCKYNLFTSKDDSFEDDDDDLLHENSDDPGAILTINQSHKNYHYHPTWLNFLCENYKSNFWFWEIVELARKVTQTLLITLFGWEDRLTVILTTCISVLFLLLHARYRPMKSSYEQGLQMFSLTVIFINVIVAANDFPDEHEGTISVILVLLNIIVLVIISGELLVTIVIHIKHIGILSFLIASIREIRGWGKPMSD